VKKKQFANIAKKNGTKKILEKKRQKKFLGFLFINSCQKQKNF